MSSGINYQPTDRDHALLDSRQRTYRSHVSCFTIS